MDESVNDNISRQGEGVISNSGIYFQDLPLANVWNKVGELRRKAAKMFSELRKPEVVITDGKYPEIIKAARGRCEVGQDEAKQLKDLHPLPTELEMTEMDSEQRKVFSETRADSIRMDLFYYPVRINVDYSEGGPEEPVRVENIRVEEPGGLPDDPTVRHFLEAKRIMFNEQIRSDEAKADPGYRAAAEGAETRYRLAIAALDGEGARTDLIPVLLREEAKYFMGEQAEAERLARRDRGDDYRNTAMWMNFRHMDGAISYIERLAKRYEDRYSLKSRNG